METSLIDTVLTTISAHTAQTWATFNRSAAAHATRSTRPMACPPRERKGRTRHRRVTTVSSTDIHIFLAPRSARRSDASNAAGWSASEAYGAKGSLAGSGARAFKRLWRTRNRAGIGTSLRAPPTARTPQTQPGGRRAEADGAIGRLQPVALARSNA